MVVVVVVVVVVTVEGPLAFCTLVFALLRLLPEFVGEVALCSLALAVGRCLLELASAPAASGLFLCLKSGMVEPPSSLGLIWRSMAFKRKSRSEVGQELVLGGIAK